MVKTCSDNFPTIGQNKCPTSAVKIRNYSYSYNLFGHCPAHQVVFFLVSCNLNALREVCMEVSKSSISQSAFLWRYRCLSRSRGRLATTLSKCISYFGIRFNRTRSVPFCWIVYRCRLSVDSLPWSWSGRCPQWPYIIHTHVFPCCHSIPFLVCVHHH